MFLLTQNASEIFIDTNNKKLFYLWYLLSVSRLVSGSSNIKYSQIMIDIEQHFDFSSFELRVKIQSNTYDPKSKDPLLC